MISSTQKTVKNEWISMLDILSEKTILGMISKYNW